MKRKSNVVTIHVGELYVENIPGYFAYRVFYYQLHQNIYQHMLFIQTQVDFQIDFSWLWFESLLASLIGLPV